MPRRNLRRPWRHIGRRAPSTSGRADGPRQEPKQEYEADQKTDYAQFRDALQVVIMREIHREHGVDCLVFGETGLVRSQAAAKQREGFNQTERISPYVNAPQDVIRGDQPRKTLG